MPNKWKSGAGPENRPTGGEGLGAHLGLCVMGISLGLAGQMCRACRPERGLSPSLTGWTLVLVTWGPGGMSQGTGFYVKESPMCRRSVVFLPTGPFTKFY